MELARHSLPSGPYAACSDRTSPEYRLDVACLPGSKASNQLCRPQAYGHLAASNPICVISPKDSYLQKMIKKYKFGKWFENGNHKDLSDWIISLKDLPSYRDKFVRNSIECNKEILKKDDVVEMFFKLIND